MRRISTLFTGSKLATAAAAAALSVTTTATLVAGGIVVSRVVDSVQGEPLGALPAIGQAQGPIVIRETDGLQDGAPGAPGATDPATSSAAPVAAAKAAPTRVVSLIDDAERVSGGVKTALDPQETGRMEEVSTFERIGSIIEDSQGDDTSDEGEEEPPQETEPEPEDPEEPNKLNDDGPLQPVQEVIEPAEEIVYSGTAAGSASPSA
jgi:hypothetical protein